MSQPTEDSPFPDPGHPAPLPDLPPVEPPTAGFIVQLFVIPAVVVAVVVVVWLLFGKLAGGERDAMDYVRLLRSSNANWRAAFELASLIQNDAHLAQDPQLLGELTDLLNHDLDAGENPQLTQYLALTLGAFHTLDARAADGRKVDPVAVLAKALAPRQPAAVRIAAAASLAKQAARLEGGLDDPGAVEALADAATHGDVELRQLAAYALGFCGGERATAALHDLLNDADRYVRYNAAVALGRRDDPAALGTFREMLSPADLEKLVTLPTRSERDHKIEAIELEAMQALLTSLSRGKPSLAQALRPELVNLTQSGLVGVRNKAQELLKNLPALPR